jgi:hypothetical protein
MTENIKDEALFIYCPTCKKKGCCVAEPEGSDLEWEVVMYWHCGNESCQDYWRDLEPSPVWWAHHRRQEELAREEGEKFFADLASSPDGAMGRDVEVACMQWTGSVLVFNGGPLNFDLLISVDEAGNECWDHPAIHPDHS